MSIKRAPPLPPPPPFFIFDRVCKPSRFWSRSAHQRPQLISVHSAVEVDAPTSLKLLTPCPLNEPPPRMNIFYAHPSQRKISLSLSLSLSLCHFLIVNKSSVSSPPPFLSLSLSQTRSRELGHTIETVNFSPGNSPSGTLSVRACVSENTFYGEQIL